jgi:RNA polymerase sigma-70 factor (ECF subfamily)
MDGTAQGLDGLTLNAADESRGEREAAFSALVERHSGLLYRVAFSLLRHPQDAEDAVQETLLKLYRGEAWRAMEDEKAFLARSVWRVGLNRLGTLGAKAMRHSQDVAEMDLASGELSPEENAVDSAERVLIRRLIDELPENFRQTLVLSAIEGMTSREVAEVMDVPEATVRTRVMRAKTELRRRFLEWNAAKEALR